MKTTRTINIPDLIFWIVVGHLDEESSSSLDDECGDLADKLKAKGCGKFELTEGECALLADEFYPALESGCYTEDGRNVEASILKLARTADRACYALRKKAKGVA